MKGPLIAYGSVLFVAALLKGLPRIYERSFILEDFFWDTLLPRIRKFILHN